MLGTTGMCPLTDVVSILGFTSGRERERERETERKSKREREIERKVYKL